MKNTEQELAEAHECLLDLTPILFKFYSSCHNDGFTKQEAMELTKQFMHSIIIGNK